MTVHNPSDLALGLDLVAAGVPAVDEAAMAAFYETNVDQVFRYLARVTGRDDGKQLLSQVFLEFFAWWPDHPEHAKPVATLYRIARCRLIDYLRRRGRATDLLLADDLASADSSHRDDLGDIVRRIDLSAALRELTERERQALGLRYVADLPVKECAEVLEVGIDNMKKILKTALKKLRQSPRMEGYQIPQTAKEAHR
ncbi:RNA polymerase sigma factor [Streptomyces fuscichromogenes]|uniref:RNA polymerase sigma factor n=1 Tax=Streptomyces fuscichromogenes TaxID=1324013 RepID=UPI0038008F43